PRSLPTSHASWTGRPVPARRASSRWRGQAGGERRSNRALGRPAAMSPSTFPLVFRPDDLLLAVVVLFRLHVHDLEVNAHLGVVILQGRDGLGQGRVAETAGRPVDEQGVIPGFRPLQGSNGVHLRVAPASVLPGSGPFRERGLFREPAVTADERDTFVVFVSWSLQHADGLAAGVAPLVGAAHVILTVGVRVRDGPAAAVVVAKIGFPILPASVVRERAARRDQPVVV